jgi:hypothetical protein
MNISRKKFIILFIISAFLFMFLSNTFFGKEPRVFPLPPESFLGTEPSTVWKSVGYKITYPIKIILVAPTLPFPIFLREDPPPPLVAAFFILYWSILSSVIHYVVDKIKTPR